MRRRLIRDPIRSATVKSVSGDRCAITFDGVTVIRGVPVVGNASVLAAGTQVLVQYVDNRPVVLTAGAGGSQSGKRSAAEYGSVPSINHEPLSLAPSAEALFSVTDQKLSVDAHSGNLVLATPGNGTLGLPAFRALVDADIPNSHTHDPASIPLTSLDAAVVTRTELDSHAALPGAHHDPVTIGEGGLSAKLGLSTQVLTLADLAHSDLSDISADQHHAGFVGLEDDLDATVDPSETDRIKIAGGTGIETEAGAHLLTLVHSTGDFGDLHTNYTEHATDETVTGLWSFHNDVRFGDELSPHLYVDVSEGTLGTSDFVSGLRGWRLDQYYAEVNNLVARGEFHSAVFAHDEIHAAGGSLLVAEASVLLNDATTPATVGSAFALDVKDPPSGHVQLFDAGDVLRMRTFDNAVLVDVWGSVSGVADNTTHFTYTLTLESGSTAAALPKGLAVINYGQLGDGRMLLTSDQANAPFLDIFETGSAPWDGVTPRVRLGKLDGITSPVFGALSGFGLWADNVYLEGSERIDGDLIVRGTVTLSHLDFTPLSGDNVIATINASNEGLTIDAAKLNLTGVLTVGDAAADVNAGTTTIDGGKITTGTIDADRLNVAILSALAVDTGALNVSDQLAIGPGGSVVAGAATLTDDGLTITQGTDDLNKIKHTYNGTVYASNYMYRWLDDPTGKHYITYDFNVDAPAGELPILILEAGAPGSADSFGSAKIELRGPYAPGESEIRFQGNGRFLDSLNIDENLDVSGSGYIGGTLNVNSKLTISAGASAIPLHVSNNYGYIDIGPQNSSGTHIYTGNDQFFFNKPLCLTHNPSTIKGYQDYPLVLNQNGTNRLTISGSILNVNGHFEGTEPVHCEIFRSAAYTTASQNWIKFPFNLRSSDDLVMYPSPDGNVYIKRTGRYQGVVNIAWASNSSGQRIVQVSLRRLGWDYIIAEDRALGMGYNSHSVPFYVPYAGVDDYIYVKVYQSSGGYLDIKGGSVFNQHCASLKMWRIT